jgi:hypothetical protein
LPHPLSKLSSPVTCRQDLDGVDHVAPDTEKDHGVFESCEDLGIVRPRLEAFRQPAITQGEGLMAPKVALAQLSLIVRRVSRGGSTSLLQGGSYAGSV